MIIEPTVGRIVWYWVNPEAMDKPHAQPEAAIVTYVHGTRMINVNAFTHDGMPVARTSVPLLQESDVIPDQGDFCQWMPYQIGQAKKHDGG